MTSRFSFENLNSVLFNSWHYLSQASIRKKSNNRMSASSLYPYSGELLRARGLLAAAAVMLLSTTLPCSTSALTTAAEWIQLQPSQRVAPRRSGHAAFVVDKIPHVFGGYIEEDAKDADSMPTRYVVNDLWKWNNKKDEWMLLDATGDIPGPRLVTAMATIQDKVYMFGGWDPEFAGTGGVILDTVHELDLSNDSNSNGGTGASWKKLDVTMPGGPTSRHVAVTIPSTGIILIHTFRCDNFVLLFDPATSEFRQQPTKGPCPSRRGLHAATMVNATTVCIFGGAAQDQNMSNESFLLDTVTWQWTKLNPTGDCPSPRAGPCLCSVSNDSDDNSNSNNCVVLFGGAEVSETGLNPRADVWALSLDKQEWTLLLDDKDGPPPRNAATLTEIDLTDQTGTGFILTGGWAPFRQTWDDCYVLRIHDE
jgi:hypothetical protein